VGIPAGVVNAVPGYGEEAGAALAAHADVALVAFTGSVATGSEIQRATAGRVAPVMLELGGKSPNIVFEDADVRAAVALSYAAIFTNQGEVCTAGSRLLVHESLRDQVVAGLLEAVEKKTVIGDPMDPATTLGPLVDGEQLKRVQGFVDRARGAGTKLLTGGGTRRVEGLNSDLFFEPTVFDEVDNHSEIAQQEVFGPVLSVIPWRDEEQAIATANSVRYGLTASVYTNDLRRAHRVVRELDAGYVWVNGASAHFMGMPYGGFKASGIGREESLDELLSYTQVKAVNVML
jgi:aldehyde dehydrogenase (NAD+)